MTTTDEAAAVEAAWAFARTYLRGEVLLGTERARALAHLLDREAHARYGTTFALLLPDARHEVFQGLLLRAARRR